MLDTDDILRARDGDREACSRLFARHWRTVRAWLLGYTRDPGEAEDLTQQTFLRAYERLRQLRDPERFLPWLRKVAQTVARNRRRRGEPTGLEVEPVSEAAADAVERTEDRKAVAAALERVSRADRSLLALVYAEDLPLAQVARLLELPVTTLRRRLAASLRRFRVAFDREGGKSHGLPHRA